jgi:hypothetical protein
MTPAETYFLGDLNGDLVHDLRDFARFRAAFNEEHGSEAFAQMFAAVPEPEAIALSVCAALVLSCRRRRRIKH